MRNGLQLCGFRAAPTQNCTVPHKGTWWHGSPEVHRGFRHTTPKANQRIHSDGPHWKSDQSSAWQIIFWLALKFSIRATACLYLFKGQKLDKLQSMPDKIHTHRMISKIPNKLLLAWLYFEATGFHSSAVSFHSLFLPLECFCKAAYKLLAWNKKMLGFFAVIWLGFF